MTDSVFRLGNWRHYLALCKLKVVALIVFTAIVGMLLATWEPLPPLDALFFGTVGIGLASMSAAAINHLVDRAADAEMARTQNRPLPSGNLDVPHALAFALALGLISMVILVVFVNMITAVLTFISLIGYAVIYTMYLKRATPQNIVIGGAAGAAPPVLGWTAVTGEVHPHSLLLFLIIFAWTPPHFWALAIHRKDEYAKVDIPMLPVTHGVEYTRLHILFYTVLLFAITMLPFATRMSGYFYFAGAIGLGIGFLYYVLLLRANKRPGIAMQTFGYSVVYLMALFAFLLVDHYLLIFA
ncbi:MAG: heme o synthase [Gammaproteobacteria bacterium]